MKILINHARSHFLFYLSLVVVIGAFVIPLIFPVYFREDDPEYMMWGISHSLAEAFSPSTGVIFGMFRPIQNILWWLLYRMFGLHPYPYQVCITMIYGLTLVLFFKLVSMMFTRRIALFTLASYVVIFYYLTYIVFWFSDFTYVLEFFFVCLSLYFLVRATRGQPKFYLLGVLAYVCAVLAKEPSALVIPAVFFLFVFSRWNELESPHKQRTIALSVILGCVGIAWLILTPGVRGRSGLDFSGGMTLILDFLLARWQYYSSILLSRFGILLLVSTLYLAGLSAICLFRHKALRSRYLLLAASGIVALVLWRLPVIALAMIFLSFVPSVLMRRKEAPAAIWFAMPLLGCMISPFFLRTYLVEASFGAAILVGVALEDFYAHSVKKPLEELPQKTRYVLTGVGITLFAAALFVFIPNVMTKIEALKIVSSTRCNFRDTIVFVKNMPEPRPKYIIIVDYSDIGDDYIHYVDSLSDLGKAHIQKTMHGYQLDVFMALISPNMPAVYNLEWLETAKERKGLLLLSMNNSENKFIQKLGIKIEVIYETHRRGEKATIYRIVDVPNGWTLPKNQSKFLWP